jgi:hypothetical protein
MLERLVDREARADGRDLEQHAARLAEVDRLEVEAVDHRRRMRPALGDAPLPGLVLVGRGREGDVMDTAGAGDARLGRRVVVRVPRAALLAAYLPHGVAVRVEVEGLLEEGPARAGIGVRAHAVEALERELAGDLRMVGDQRLIGGLHDGELEVEPLGVAEAQASLVAVEVDALRGQPVVPELDRVLGGDAEDDAVDHPAAGAAGMGVRVLEEGQVAACVPLLVRVEEVVDRRVVLVHRFLDEPQPEDAHVEVDVARRVAGDARDVVNPLEAHPATVTIGL